MDQLQAEKKKSDTAQAQAKDEARAAAASLATAQGELDQAHDHIAEITRPIGRPEGEERRAEPELETARAEVAEARSAAQAEMAGIKSELDSIKTDLELAKGDHDRLKSESDAKLHAAEEEANQLRARISELEQGNAKNEDRIVKAYQKIKGDEKLRGEDPQGHRRGAPADG